MIKINLSNKEIQDGKIDVLSTTSIGQGRNLHVVKVGNQNILIGATQNSITYIADVKSEKVQGENYDAKNS